MGNDGEGTFGGFWRRVLATLLDVGVVSLLLGAAGFLLGIISGVADQDLRPPESVLTIAPVALFWLYDTLTTAGDKQATPGKRAVGLKVVDEAGHSLSWGRANIRFWSKALSAAPALIGFLMAAFARQKIGLHDLIARTRVVTSHATAADSAQPDGKGLRPINAFLILLSVLIILPSLLFVDDVDFRLFSVSQSRLKEMAEEGNLKAQHKLGVQYLKEKEGLERNPAQALEWFRKSAEQGYAPAQFNVGLIHGRGKGDVPRDKALAAEWFRKAARQGHADAQYVLGIMMMKGQGMPRNQEKGLAWVQKAAEQGQGKAQQFLEDLQS